MGLIDRIFNKREAETAEAWKRYRELLESDADSANAANEMDRLMVRLNRTAEDLRLDRNEIAQAREWVEQIKAGWKNDGKAKEANDAIRKHNEETKVIVEERRTQLGNIVRESYRIDAIDNAARNARMMLDDHLRKHGPLLQEIADEVAKAPIIAPPAEE